MVKSYKNFNFVCAILSAFFLFGTIWIMKLSANSLQITNNNLEFTNNNYQITDSRPSFNSVDRQVADDSELIAEENNNIAIEQYNNEVTSSSEIKIKEAPELLPSKINLDIPFTSQAPEKNWDQPWQDACEEAAVLMLDAYYKGYGLSPLFARDEILKMVAWEDGQGWGSSIEAKDVVELGEWYIITTHDSRNTTQTIAIVEDITVEEIKRFVANGDPVLVLAYGKVLPNPHFRNGGPEYHALIIRGYDDETGEFITNDPGTQFGKNFLYKYNDLMEAIHDWNNGDVKNGNKVMIVIE